MDCTAAVPLHTCKQVLREFGMCVLATAKEGLYKAFMTPFFFCLKKGQQAVYLKRRGAQLGLAMRQGRLGPVAGTVTAPSMTVAAEPS
eukprot:scaffold123630_cov21-Tisochrysis_lutea.AAC.2